jgi:hypothetical protein
MIPEIAGGMVTDKSIGVGQGFVRHLKADHSNDLRDIERE